MRYLHKQKYKRIFGLRVDRNNDCMKGLTFMQFSLYFRNFYQSFVFGICYFKDGRENMDYKSHVMHAINYMEENLKNEITLSDCARVSGYSEYHFISGAFSRRWTICYISYTENDTS